MSKVLSFTKGVQKTLDESLKLMANKNDAQVDKIIVPVLTNTLYPL